MRAVRYGYVTGPLIGGLWGVVMAVVIAVVVSFATGAGLRPVLLPAFAFGAWLGLVWLPDGGRGMRARLALGGALAVVVLAVFWLFGLPLAGAAETGLGVMLVAWLLCAAAVLWPLLSMLRPLPFGVATRHEFEDAVIRFLTGFGYIFFTALVAIPFYVMVMTSLKSQQALLLNPLDFSLDLERGWGLFRSYFELFGQFNFGDYLLTSFFVSVMTVFITLLFSVPGAYAVARLRFRGRAAMGRSILLIYMVPMIVLALPIYIAFSMLELRNSLVGILMIYPVTTIPVALYMLQGYFRGLPAEVEEAGLMDGLSRLAVIWKITLPLSLPALASVSLYVFMIAWNEFLLAFMLLDDPSKFTLTRGVAMLNSSEIPRQHLMAGSVIATVPIMVIFLGLEKFMTKGLTAGSVKG
ncbi:carbohydrate ABC transporter permease [Algicella marina]|uniref:ABC transporter permease subunit n=1 Tax=Algicella marina TaxID=2683284 RepID=A0A6P1T414_9RHOB|nr:carbohydrate ABC transporter permease [Algicella marina]QHQ37488.1 ABC transporter permease subunit [Algicella marina]